MRGIGQAYGAAKALGGDYEVEKVSELSTIMAFGIFTTPALVVDGEVKVVGQVPGVEEIKKLIARRFINSG